MLFEVARGKTQFTPDTLVFYEHFTHAMNHFPKLNILHNIHFKDKMVNDILITVFLFQRLIFRVNTYLYKLGFYSHSSFFQQSTSHSQIFASFNKVHTNRLDKGNIYLQRKNCCYHTKDSITRYFNFTSAAPYTKSNSVSSICFKTLLITISFLLDVFHFYACSKQLLPRAFNKGRF